MALKWLLMTRATMDSHCRELELKTKLSVCMNEAQAIKTIKEAEVSHVAEIKEAKVHHAAKIKEAEVHHAATIKEAMLHHTTRIKEAKACYTTNSFDLQQNPEGKYVSTRV